MKNTYNSNKNYNILQRNANWKYNEKFWKNSNNYNEKYVIFLINHLENTHNSKNKWNCKVEAGSKKKCSKKKWDLIEQFIIMKAIDQVQSGSNQIKSYKVETNWNLNAIDQRIARHLSLFGPNLVYISSFFDNTCIVTGGRITYRDPRT